MINTRCDFATGQLVTRLGEGGGSPHTHPEGHRYASPAGSAGQTGQLGALRQTFVELVGLIMSSAFQLPPDPSGVGGGSDLQDRLERAADLIRAAQQQVSSLRPDTHRHSA